MLFSPLPLLLRPPPPPSPSHPPPQQPFPLLLCSFPFSFLVPALACKEVRLSTNNMCFSPCRLLPPHHHPPAGPAPVSLTRPPGAVLGMGHRRHGRTPGGHPYNSSGGNGSPGPGSHGGSGGSGTLNGSPTAVGEGLHHHHHPVPGLAGVVGALGGLGGAGVGGGGGVLPRPQNPWAGWVGNLKSKRNKD